MTVSVSVKTRAWGATVTVRTFREGSEGHTTEESSRELAPHSSWDIHLGGKTTIEVVETVPTTGTAEDSSPPLDPHNVPGRKENDELIKPVGKTKNPPTEESGS